MDFGCHPILAPHSPQNSAVASSTTAPQVGHFIRGFAAPGETGGAGAGGGAGVDGGIGADGGVGGACGAATPPVGDCGAAVGSPAPIRLPHSPQKRAFGSSGLPQDGHDMAGGACGLGPWVSGAPQLPQNLRPGVTAAPHEEQVTKDPVAPAPFISFICCAWAWRSAICAFACSTCESISFRRPQASARAGSFNLPS